MPYLEFVIREFSDDDLCDMIAEGFTAHTRADLCQASKELRVRRAASAQRELERRAEMRKLAQVRELAHEMMLRGVNTAAMQEAHAYAVARAMELQAA